MRVTVIETLGFNRVVELPSWELVLLPVNRSFKMSPEVTLAMKLLEMSEAWPDTIIRTAAGLPAMVVPLRVASIETEVAALAVIVA